MNLKNLLTLSFILVVLLAPAGVVSASTPNTPTAAPCGPGTAYDPGCDVNHDSKIDVIDVQLTADKWNQSDTWFGDNDHDHLGQMWTGTDNPLWLTGSFGAPDYAPLVLSNSYINGSGLRIYSASGDGVAVGGVGGNGVSVSSASDDGFNVANATDEGLSVGSVGGDGVGISWASGDGVSIQTAGASGMSVGSAGSDGMKVQSAGDDGFFICQTGNATSCTDRADLHNGVEIGSTQDHGIRIDDAGLDGVAIISADRDGVHVETAGGDGLYVCAAGVVGGCTPQMGLHNGVEIAHSEHDGLHVNGADRDGVRVTDAGQDGLHVAYASRYGLKVDTAGDIGLWVSTDNMIPSSELAAYFLGSIQVVGDCINCRNAVYAINAGDTDLQPGDLVTLAGLKESSFGDLPMLLEVRAAFSGGAVIGIVQGRAEITSDTESRPEDPGPYLAPRQGSAAPGEFLTIVYSGLAQVKVSAVDGPIEQGSKLVAGVGGTTRAQRVVEVEGVKLAESASSIGIALEGLEAGEGLVWALVNVQ